MLDVDSVRLRMGNRNTIENKRIENSTALLMCIW